MAQLTTQANERINKALSESKFFSTITIVAEYKLQLTGRKTKEQLKHYLTKLELTRLSQLTKPIKNVIAD